MKTSNIYDKHRAAFSRVTAAALVKNGNQIGTIAFKYPADGAGRLYCYLHIHGEEMVRGSASGYGYDKAGAAFNTYQECCNNAKRMRKVFTREQMTALSDILQDY